MENDQTIFQNPTQEQTLPNPIVPSSSASPIAPTQPPVEAQKVQSPIINSRMNFNGGSGKIIKILIGLFALIIFIIIVFIIINLVGKNVQKGPVILTYWGLWEDSKTMAPIITDFERTNPNIKVNYVKEDIKQYRESLTTRINNGNGPDVFTYHNSWYPMLAAVVSPFPVNSLSKSDFDNFYPVAKEDLVKNGAIYGIPVEMDTLAMYINKDHYQAAGITPAKTWDDFIKDVRVLTVKDEGGKIKTAGAAMGTFSNVTHAPDIISLLFLQNGVDVSNLEKSADRATGALDFYTSFALDQNNVWDDTLDPSILAFSKGNLSTYFGYSWDYFTIKSNNPTLNFEIHPVPQLVGQDINLASYWAVGVSSKSKNQKEAFLLAKFLSQKQTEENLFLQESKQRAFGQPYARVDLQDTLKDNPLVYPFVLQGNSAKSSLFVDSTFDNGLNQQANTYLSNAINSILAGSSSQTALNTLSAGVSQILLQYEGQK